MEVRSRMRRWRGGAVAGRCGDACAGGVDARRRIGGGSLNSRTEARAPWGLGRRPALGAIEVGWPPPTLSEMAKGRCTGGSATRNLKNRCQRQRLRTWTQGTATPAAEAVQGPVGPEGVEAWKCGAACAGGVEARWQGSAEMLAQVVWTRGGA